LPTRIFPLNAGEAGKTTGAAIADERIELTDWI
jgi:hypothetical protein